MSDRNAYLTIVEGSSQNNYLITLSTSEVYAYSYKGLCFLSKSFQQSRYELIYGLTVKCNLDLVPLNLVAIYDLVDKVYQQKK